MYLDCKGRKLQKKWLIVKGKGKYSLKTSRYKIRSQFDPEIEKKRTSFQRVLDQSMNIKRKNSGKSRKNPYYFNTFVIFLAFSTVPRISVTSLTPGRLFFTSLPVSSISCRPRLKLPMAFPGRLPVRVVFSRRRREKLWRI